jgi:hypothetical protein
MGVLLYVLIPVLIVGLVAAANWFRNRQPSSLQAGVDSFRREMEALSPDARFQQRGDQPEARTEPPRRQPGAD